MSGKRQMESRSSYWREGGDMASEAHCSNSAVNVEPEAQRSAQIASVPAAGIGAGMVLTVSLLLLALPFSDKIAVSLSLLS